MIKKYKAIFSEVKKDLYLETWLKYYSQFFDDIYIVDTEPHVEDIIMKEAAKKYKFTRITDYQNGSWSMEISRNQIQEFQHKLLEQYKWVLFSHADEFVVPDPDKYKDLSDYIDKCDKDFVFCNGYDVFQMFQEKDHTPDEPMLDLTQPILKQRKYWNHSISYCKPLLSRIPLSWMVGFHNIKDVHDDELEARKEPDLYLLHLKNADYNIFGKRIAGKFSYEKGYDWFYKEHEKKELIPERFKNIL